MNINGFLARAKKNTYASSSEGSEKILDDGSKELIYEEDGWKYRDRYFGLDPFIGQEVVWKEDKLVWAMNYYGRTLSNCVPTREVYQFLRKALKMIKKSSPFRGPRKFREGDFLYTTTVNQEAENFIGLELIFYKHSTVYELRYHDGLVRNK